MKLDLKEVNEKYTKAKEEAKKIDITKIEEKINNLNTDLKNISRLIEDKVIESLRTEEDGDKEGAQRIQEETNILREEKRALEDKLKKLQTVIKNSREKVESHIKSLKENPEMAAYIDQCLIKRFVRQIKDIRSKKKQALILKSLVEEHPTFENNIVGMVNARDEIKKLEDELSTLTSPADDARINEIENVELPKLNEKFDKNKAVIMNFVGKQDIGLDEEYLVDFVKDGSGKFSHYKDGTNNINISKSLKNTVKSLDKLEGKYVQGLSNLGINLKNKEDQNKNKKVKKENSLVVKEEKPKWYQFIKRFKNWNETRKVKREEKEEPKPKNVIKDISSSEFKTSLKYDVVQQYMKEREDELLGNISKKKEEGR